MKHKKRKVFLVLTVLVSIILLCLFFFVLKFEKNNTLIDIECTLRQGQEIIPVLYYEDFYGLNGYDTHTFAIENKKAITLEKHYRTWAKTYPTYALDKFGGAISAMDEFGQLMIYYKLHGEEVFVFDKFLAKSPSNEYCIIKNNYTTSIPYVDQQGFFDFLCFGENYYLFTFLQTNPNLSDYDVIRVYKLSKTLVLEDVIDINYHNFGLYTHNFINKSLAIAENTLIAIFKNGNNNFFLKHNMQNGSTELIPAQHELIGIISDENCFYAISYLEDSSLVFETLTLNGEIKNEIVATLPFNLKISPETTNFDNILYLNNSEIYCCFQTDEKCVFLSYNITLNEWTNYWIIQKHKSLFLPMDVKYVLKKENNYYDIFPNCNSSK